MNTNDVRVLDVYGRPRERGRAIGESLRESIRSFLYKHEHAIAHDRGYSVRDYCAALDEFGQYQNAIAKWVPELSEEVIGLAEGAGIPLATAHRLQLLDEDWFFDTYHYRKTQRIKNKCTSFALTPTPGHPAFAGQNMDIMSYVDGHQVLLRIHEEHSDHVSLVFTYAGLIGLVGINSAAMGINCNTLMQLGCRRTGVPVAYIVRGALAKPSYEEALKFLQGLDHATGQNYILSSHGQIGCYECSPWSVREYVARADGRRVCHTNHPLVNEDLQQFEALSAVNPESSWLKTENTHARFASVAARIVYNDSSIQLTDLKAMLRSRDDPDNPICRDRSTKPGNSSISFTAGSLIYEYSDPPLLHFAAGPPLASEFRTFSVRDSVFSHSGGDLTHA